MRFWINLALTGLIAAGIMTGTLLPVTGGRTMHLVALVGHLAAYFALAGALLLVFHDTTTGHMEAILIAAVFGLGMELMQGVLPYRTMTVKDIAVNILGASLIMLDHHLEAVTRIVSLEDRLIEKYLL